MFLCSPYTVLVHSEPCFCVHQTYPMLMFQSVNEARRPEADKNRCCSHAPPPRLTPAADYPGVLPVRLLGHPANPEAHPQRGHSTPGRARPPVAPGPLARPQLRGEGPGICVSRVAPQPPSSLFFISSLRSLPGVLILRSR